MKKKMVMVVIIVVAVIALILAGWYVMFMHFGIGPKFPFVHVEVIELELPSGEMSATAPLMSLAESEEEARNIAELYGIVFVSFQNGVATYYTDEDPYQVIARGEENGYPAVYINYRNEPFDS
ncbi:MAG: hypothetical protein J1F18_12835 [Lachnospiraceae bacterium]|nr:hypothetical protein [Lachnospiraceae bacterium]